MSEKSMEENLLDEVFEHCKQYFDKEGNCPVDAFSDWDLYNRTLDSIAVKFGGVVWNTGGGCMVAILPVKGSPQHCIGVNDECCVLYNAPSASSTPVEVFFSACGDEEVAARTFTI